MSDTFKTIARFQYSTEAQIIKGRLEADGIQVFLFDNLTIDTDPLVSNAIKCPNCKSDKIELYSTINDAKALFAFVFAFITNIITSTLPIYTKHKYRCEDCKTEFDLKEIRSVYVVKEPQTTLS